MNSGTAEGNNGTLTNGTTDNIRWKYKVQMQQLEHLV